MARQMFVTLGLLSTAAAQEQQVLFQRRGVASNSMAPSMKSQLAMIQELAKDVVEHKRPLTDGEKTTLDMIDTDIIGPNLKDITDAHNIDAGTLQDAVDAVAACETDLDGKIKTAGELDTAAKAEWSKHESCRNEEKSLKGEMEAAKSRLDDFLKDSKDQLPSCEIPGAEADTKSVRAFMDAQATWYDNHEKNYNIKLADWNARIKTHADKVIECDAQQQKAQEATCKWRSFVVVSQAEYSSCRSRTLTAHGQVLTTNKANADDRKAEWEAMKHLQCYITTLKTNIEATGDQLSHCEGETIDTEALTIVEPAVAPVAQSKLDGMGDMSTDHGCAQ